VPIEHNVDLDSGILFVRRWGSIDTQDEEEALRKRVEDPLVTEGIPVLVDCREVSPPDSVKVVKYLAHNATNLAKNLKCGPVAIVVGTEAEYGMARMYASLTDLVHDETKVFRDYGEALQWLIVQSGT